MVLESHVGCLVTGVRGPHEASIAAWSKRWFKAWEGHRDEISVTIFDTWGLAFQF